MRNLEEYHKVWLECHPGRDEEWLRAVFREDFGIHHIDGNYDNNDPTNLVLIYWGDHAMIHNGLKRPIREVKLRDTRRSKPPWSKSLVVGERCFNLRCEGVSWEKVAETEGLPDKSVALKQARRYARAMEKTLPKIYVSKAKKKKWVWKAPPGWESRKKKKEKQQPKELDMAPVEGYVAHV